MSSARPRLALEVVGAGAPPVELPASGRLVVGSSRERADLCIDGQGVDPLHCTIGRLKGGGWALKDLGSQAGTFVNGQRVESARLAAGDSLLLGTRRLRIVDPASPPPSGEAPAAARPGAAPAPAVPGFRIERPLGRGATGTVWLAVQESLDRRVALKVLAPRLAADREFVARFQAEARAAAALHHPHVVTVFDVGESGGHHWLSMEYMARGCLESRVAAEGALPWREVLGVLRDAGQGLVYAEQRGMVHRDLKPANLMQNELGQTKIADLGLAAQVEQEGFQAEGAQLVGTPHFLAPELIRGGRPDARSDLYSLGATAYRLLSGHTPFEGASTKNILRAALREEVPPLSRHVPGIPERVEVLVRRMLAKDPLERLPSAAILVRELDALLADPGGAPATPGRGKGALAGALLALLLLGAAGAAWALLGNGGAGGGSGDRNSRAAPAHSGGTASADTGTADATPPPGDAGTAGSGAPPERAGELLTAQAFELYETQAENAYLKLGERVLDEEQRVAALRALAGEFDGTTMATRAREEADTLERALVESRRAEHARLARVEAKLAELRSAAGLGATPPRPGDALRRIAAVHDQEGFAGDADFERGRDALVGEVLDEALAFARSGFARAEALAQEGDFDAMAAILGDLAGAIHFEDSESGAQPAGVAELRSLAARARELVAQRDALAATWRREQRLGERLAVAEALAEGRGLAGELRALELDAALERLERLEARLATESAREFAARTRAELAAARGVLAALTQGFARGEWRRKLVSDPRVRGSATTWDTVGADAHGLVLSSGGTTEHLPWAAWGANPDEIDKLLRGRLSRDWTSAELHGIAVLLASAAVVELAARAQAPLAGTRPAGRAGHADIATLFAPVEGDWSWPPQARALIERERAAARVLADALAAANAGHWSIASTHARRLLEEHGQSLLARLLSDGRERASDAPAPAAPAPSNGPGEEGEAAGEEEGSAAQAPEGEGGAGGAAAREPADASDPAPEGPPGGDAPPTDGGGRLDGRVPRPEATDEER